MKHPHEVDVAVLLVFFCRPAPFAQVFEQVRMARPSRLYLYQDGPRPDHHSDVKGIEECRAIAANIDWECEVQTLYQERNVGCGRSGYLAERWLFENEETGIVLEDDAVPSQSFFRFCAELLERYRDDDRIDRICGMNNVNVSTHSPYSYVFTQKGSMCAWAGWRRVVDGWDPTYSWLDNTFTVEQLKACFDRRDAYDFFIEKCKAHRATGHPYHESVGVFACLSNHRLMIMTRENQVTNVGVCADSTHSPAELRLLPRRVRRIFFMKRHEIAFPLSHPPHVIRDKVFERSIEIVRWDRLKDRAESTLLMLRYGDFSRIGKWFARVRSGRRF